MSDLISRKALLEESMDIGKQPMPDIRTKKDLEQAITNFYHTFLNIITNAPAIEQNVKCSSHPDAQHGFCRDASHTANRYVCECEGWTPPSQPQEQVEPVAIVDEIAISWDGKHIFNAVGKVNVVDKLYTTPPQPQAVKDALEKAAMVVQAKIGHYYPTPLTDAVTEIRALIEKDQTMTQQNNEFVKWFDKQLDNENAFTSDEPICKQSWIAAKADNVREIAELRAKVSELDGMLGSLQSYINVLREALEEASIFVDNHSEDWYKSGQVLLIKCKQALASTPAQSLQSHDDKVIERVVTLLKDSAWDDGIIDMRVDDLIEDVRKLKGK